MDNQQYNTEELKQRFLLGDLTPKEEYVFRKRMRSDPALKEEIEILKAMQHVETEKFIAANFSEKGRIIPVYRQTWFRAAAAVLVVLGLGWLTRTSFAPEKTMLTATVPVRQSVDGSLGWAPSAPNSEQVIAVVTQDEAGALRYRYDGDTLKIFTPASLKPISGKGGLYLVDDLKNRRLVLVIDGKKYAIEAGANTETPLTEEP